MSLRREFDLLPDDRQFLEEYGLPWETIADGSQWVLIHEFPTHEFYNHPRVTAAIRLDRGRIAPVDAGRDQPPGFPQWQSR